MRAASDIADWWDTQRKESEKALDQFVEDHPNWFGVLVATATATAMELGAGTVDALRLGEGVAQGTAKGVAQDALRLLQIVPVAGKLAKAGAKPVFAQLAKVLADPAPKLGICTYVAAAKALRHVGASLATVEELGRALNRPMAVMGKGEWIRNLAGTLRSFGASVRPLPGLKTLEDVNAAVPKDGVVVFAIEWLDRVPQGIERSLHTIYAFRRFGKVVYADRTGVVKSLEELERLQPGYGRIGTARLATSSRLLGEAEAVAEPVLVKGISALGETTADFAKSAGKAAYLISQAWHSVDLRMARLPTGKMAPALEVKVGAVADAETVAQAFEVAKAAPRHVAPAGQAGHAAASPHASRHTNWPTHTVVAGESLWTIARHHYGHGHKWPLIWEANRKVVGANPDLIHPGQQILIPPLPRVRGNRKKG